ncbi:hypothetical protein [uncultured Methylobacterium sp.]|jgi:hypothetical protein|uniref:hypothetical protein n=1 Tax=uncultured Methylobacterium sp. TaxID=157278 RepID=UPI002623BBCF|nr:hypothetical protein [uncultured Methylobacterium sp.]
MTRNRSDAAEPGTVKPRSVYDQESYAQEYARTAGDQAAFFREQVERRRREADQARAFADISGDRGEEAARARRLDMLGDHEAAVAETFEARARRPN